MISGEPTQLASNVAPQPLAAFEVPRAVYVHVPFCVHRCGYCDFTLVAGRDDLQAAYLEALEVELHAVADRPQVDTVFLGGGTPTQLTASNLARLLERLRTQFDWAHEGEFSVEANPLGLTDDKLQVLKDAGINRLSLGIQSFDAQVLATLERDHREGDILDCVERCRRYFQNVALDLIFAVPGQSLDLWQETLQRAVALPITHLSTYGLTIEKGTSFWTRRTQGTLPEVANELEAQMYLHAMEWLAQAGFEQYEISNFSRVTDDASSFTCRHNQVYWAGRPYWGFGPGAASYLQGVRRLNHRSTTTWIKRVLNGQSGVFESECLEPEDRAREALVLGLRTVAGIQPPQFKVSMGYDLDALVGDELRVLERRGWIFNSPDRVALTPSGRCFADSVAGMLLR